MKLTIPITPELRVRLLHAENLEIEVPDTAVPKGWQVVKCEPFAWSYEWASCITTDGPQNFKAVIEREAPPQWAIDDGQARKIVPLYTTTQTVPEGWQLVPFNPAEDQWGGLARAIVSWMRSYPSNQHTPRTLVEFITSLGHTVPDWLKAEPEMLSENHVISKGTVAVLVYKAMLSAAPKPEGGDL